MKWPKRILFIFIEWFRPNYLVEYVSEVPEIIRERNIYIVGEPGQHWLLVFNCPCGCKQLIQLNLLTDAQPTWKFAISHKGNIDISPSVWRLTGCRSHFFIKKARVRWCK